MKVAGGSSLAAEEGQDVSVGDLQALVLEQGRKLETLLDMWAKRPDTAGSKGVEQEAGASAEGTWAEGMAELGGGDSQKKKKKRGREGET